MKRHGPARCREGHPRLRREPRTLCDPARVYRAVGAGHRTPRVLTPACSGASVTSSQSSVRCAARHGRTDIYQAVSSYLNKELSDRDDVASYVTERTAKKKLGIKTGEEIRLYARTNRRATGRAGAEADCGSQGPSGLSGGSRRGETSEATNSGGTERGTDRR